MNQHHYIVGGIAIFVVLILSLTGTSFQSVSGDSNSISSVSSSSNNIDMMVPSLE